MASWKTRGLRGSMLEEVINHTNDLYKDKRLGLIQKIPTPITPIKIDDHTRQITLAYFEKKSTVDFIGVVQGIPICFDAKECGEDTFSLNNIHQHQIEFMKDFEEQSGIAFILIHYTKRDKYYYLSYEQLDLFYQRALDGGRKSFRYDELDLDYFIPITNGFCIHYLETLQKDLSSR